MLYEYAAGILFCRYSHPPTPKGPVASHSSNLHSLQTVKGRAHLGLVLTVKEIGNEIVGFCVQTEKYFHENVFKAKNNFMYTNKCS